MVAQRYQSANPFSKQAQVPNNEFGIWDFRLQHVGSDYGDSYRLRVVNNNGDTQALSGYTDYPELRIVGSTLSVDIVNSSGVPVSNPKVVFPSLFSSFAMPVKYGHIGNSSRTHPCDRQQGFGQLVAGLVCGRWCICKVGIRIRQLLI